MWLARVLRVGRDVAHRALGPGPDRPSPPTEDGPGRRVLVQIEVESISNLVERELRGHTPDVDLGDDRATDKATLDLAERGLRRDWTLLDDNLISVRRLTMLKPCSVC
ncbi:MAG: hypothetical protein QOE61_3073 [Micromonosporaceae bacterium]|nr:hypothetical protein [Micromonosporaceae bacterium]